MNLEVEKKIPISLLLRLISCDDAYVYVQGVTIATCLAVRVEKWRFLVILRGTCVPKQSSSLTHKGKQVVSHFASKAEKEAQCVGVRLCTQSKHNITLNGAVILFLWHS